MPDRTCAKCPTLLIGSARKYCGLCVHGTSVGYKTNGCRCATCRAFNNSSMQAGHAKRWRDKQRALGVNLDRRHQIICVMCGVGAVVTSPRCRFCSHDCDTLYRMQNNLPPFVRTVHSTDLVHVGPMDRSHIHPKHLARRQVRQHQPLNGGNMIAGGSCEWCEEPFLAICQTGNPKSLPKFCSKRCAGRASRSKAHQKNGRFVPHAAKRRRVYERDGWKCQLCQCNVDPAATNEWRASLDHIVPQSHELFPDHSESNLRLVHMWCNQVRGAAVLPDEWFLPDRSVA